MADSSEILGVKIKIASTYYRLLCSSIFHSPNFCGSHVAQNCLNNGLSLLKEELLQQGSSVNRLSCNGLLPRVRNCGEGVTGGVIFVRLSHVFKSFAKVYFCQIMSFCCC